MADEGKPVERVKTVDEYHEQTPRRWPMLLLYLVLALIVAAILVFGARSVYRHNHKLAKKSTTSGSSSSTSGSSGDISVSDGSSTSSNNSSSSNSHSSGSSSSTSGSSSNLPNSGPGQLAGLFIGATLAGTGVHYIVSSQRRSKAS